MNVFVEKFIELEPGRVVEVLSRGHFPDTLIVRDSNGKEFQIPWNKFYSGVPSATDQNN